MREDLIAKSLQALYEQRAQLNKDLAGVEAAIRQVESLRGSGQSIEKRAGRKSMGDAERVEVSERMKRYWARRRAGRGGA